MRITTFAMPLAGLLLSACAGTVPSPRFSGLDPADPQAPESSLPARSSLMDEAEETLPAPTTSPTKPPGQEHHSMEAPAAGAATAKTYSCPMHPSVQAKEPGHCPICGMTLVRQAARPEAEPK